VTGDLRKELKNHRVFMEVLALASSNSEELKHIVRYFNSWVEDFSKDEMDEENKYIE
jgi:hypothetical protein